MQTLRIFISSPGDVADERQLAGKVIERLQGKYWSFVRLDDVFWEQKMIRYLLDHGGVAEAPTKSQLFQIADRAIGFHWHLGPNL